MLHAPHLLAAVLICASMFLPCPTGAGEMEITLESQTPIPEFKIDGHVAHIHSQGLFVDDRYIWVTGRLETAPKRALLVRIDRAILSDVEVLDLTPPEVEGQRLDHPGGFDFDGKSFWIPISGSSPKSPSVIVRVPYRPKQRLASVQVQTVFQVDDHIGAIAINRDNGHFYGANWDTKVVHAFSPQGKRLRKIKRENLVAGDPQWALAVQDWKGLGGGRVLAGGIDKRANPTSDQPRAMIGLLDVDRQQLVAKARLKTPKSWAGHVTNEGLAIKGDQLFLLPGDLGKGAIMFHYRWRLVQ